MLTKILAVTAGLAVVASVLVATDAASADAGSFANPSAPSSPDYAVTSIDLERTPVTMTETLHMVGLSDSFVGTISLEPYPEALHSGTGQSVSITILAMPGSLPTITAYTVLDGLLTTVKHPSDLKVTTTTDTITVALNPFDVPWSGSVWSAGKISHSPAFSIFATTALGGLGPVTGAGLATTATIVTSATSQAFGQGTTSVSAAVTPAIPGTVEFFDGTASLGKAVTGVGLLPPTVVLPASLPLGDHSLSAIFTPTSPRFAVGTASRMVLHVVNPAIPVVPSSPPSNSTTSALAVPVKTATSVAVRLTHSTQHYKGKRVTATIAVAGRPAGKVRLYDGTHKLATLTLKKGKATFKFPAKLSKKKHAISAVFIPTDVATYVGSTSKKLTLKVVK